MKDVLWNSLVTATQGGQCVLVLGPEVPARPQGENGGGGRAQSLREAFCDYLLQQLGQACPAGEESVLFATAQQFEDSPDFSSATLRNNAAAFFRTPRFGPGPLHESLARFPFGLVLTTCHDQLFARALKEQMDKSPSKSWYHFRGEPRDNKEIDTPLHPDTPAIYHLFGTFDEPNSLVLTENDLLDFAIHMIAAKPGLPDSLRSALRNKTFLFVGFGIQHWYIRVMLKLVIRALDVSAGSVALERLGALDVREREQTALFYRRGTRVEVVDMEAAEFLDELWRRYQAAGGYLGATRRLKRPQVFISYERSDEPVARQLFEALPQDSIEPLLDRQFLNGGDEWNAVLEQKLVSSDYFLVLNSANLVAKRDGYVNKELNLALDRQLYRAGRDFIIPLGVGGLSPEQGRAELREIQQLPLRPGESFADDVSQIAKTIVRKFQLRSRQA